MKVIVAVKSLNAWETTASALEQAGFGRGQVDLIVGVQEDGDQIVALNPNGDFELLSESYGLALVGGQLAGDYSGAELVGVLTSRGLRCVAFSTDEARNERMVSAGACLSCVRGDLLSAVRAGVLSLTVLAEYQRPSILQRALDRWIDKRHSEASTKVRTQELAGQLLALVPGDFEKGVWRK